MKMTEDDKLKRRILDILLKDTLIKSSLGYSYVYTALYLCCRDGGLSKNLVDGIYKEVARLYNTETKRVIRSIRYSLTRSKLGKTFSEVLQTVLLMLEHNIR